MKVLHLPTTVGGHPQELSRAEKKLGLESYSLTFYQNYFQYPVDYVLFIKGHFFTNLLKRWLLILKELKKYDVIHYNFGMFASPHEVDDSMVKKFALLRKVYNLLYGGFFQGFDLKLLKKYKKVIAVTFQGDDARQGDYCSTHYSIHFVHEVGKDYYTKKSDQQKRERIKLFDKYADLIYSVNPDLLNVLPEKAHFIPYANVDPGLWEPRYVRANLKEPHIVHAPTHRAVKGTKYLEAAIRRLKVDGVPFRYTQVEGMTNAEAKKIYETADLLVDQLLAGWYGGLAVELMSSGKPVICYIRESDLRHIPVKMRVEIPIINATPDTIYEVLKEWLTIRKPELHSRGIASRKYVEKWHDPLKIASIIKKDYETVYNAKKQECTIKN